MSLCNNHLTELPESIGNLTSLLSLHLDNNDIAKLPMTMNRLIALKKLSLR
ncbi:MAG: hypothetical protein BAJALOKI1v1_1670006 [Promethearchaeota archaeon]|nr:MAG: hypothetical protein BAJALOKI1v1_1670006 [Candidatus Lokiarchaeota archaeon]